METQIYHMISDFLKGKSSESERRKIDAWLNKSDGNRQIFEEIEKVWNLTGSLQTNIQPDINAEWKKFEKLRNESHLKDREPKKQLNPFLRFAAIVIPAFLILSISLFLFFHKKSIHNISVKTNNEVIIKMLADRSKITLNKNSILTYPEQFNKEERRVKIEGEAFFEISETGKPFVVEAGATQIRVLGTRFIVRNYHSENKTEVLVEEGKVCFTVNKQANKSSILENGEKAVFNTINSSMQKATIQNENTFSWATHVLSFDNTPLGKIKNDLSDYFCIEVVIPDEMTDCLFSGEFTQPELKGVLEVLSLSIECNYKISNDSVYISGVGCR